jgi:hypothetical protein
VPQPRSRLPAYARCPVLARAPPARVAAKPERGPAGRSMRARAGRGHAACSTSPHGLGPHARACRRVPQGRPAARSSRATPAARKPPVQPRSGASGRRAAPRGQTQAKILAALCATPGSTTAAAHRDTDRYRGGDDLAARRARARASARGGWLLAGRDARRRRRPPLVTFVATPTSTRRRRERAARGPAGCALATKLAARDGAGRRQAAPAARGRARWTTMARHVPALGNGWPTNTTSSVAETGGSRPGNYPLATSSRSCRACRRRGRRPSRAARRRSPRW